jgi:hypothetical protein
MTIDKLISFQIERQFPAIYREDGPELVQFIKEYYKFLETQDNQSIYNGRRMFEYKDIDTTLNRFLIFFKKKYLTDLPFNDETIRLIVKNILGLYRRKGTQGGLELFFRLFYNEEIKVYYPSKDVLKPSDSNWKRGSYLQIVPNDGIFTSTRSSRSYTYNDIIGKTIIGSASRARATVDKINFVLINNSLIPIIFINDITSNFIGLENIFCQLDGNPVSFGIINGSLTNIAVDTSFRGTLDNEVGDLVTFRTSPDGIGGRGLVTEVTENFTGIVEYSVIDGGWGYSVDSTKLLVSNQIIFLDNAGGKFTPLETLEDSFGNRGIVIGQNDISVGVKMEDGDEFANSENIFTVDRDVNINISTLSPIDGIRLVAKNDTSPGQLFPDTANTADVILAEITNEETVSLIFDIIGDYANVTIDSSNYNDPPAQQPMSGSTDPVTANTVLSDAFDLTPVELGSIVRFGNLDPGIDYVNDVFAVAYDTRLTLFTKKNQLVTLEDLPATLGVGSEIAQGSIQGRVVALQNNTLTVRPYSYFGFNSTTPITFGGSSWNIVSVATDFSSTEISGFNANIGTITSFGVGKITAVLIIDSGYGYADNKQVQIIDSEGNIAALGTTSSRGQGSSGGFWSSFNSHLNGYLKTEEDDGVDDYFEAGKRIHDNNFYQEYAYEIQSKIDLKEYEESLKAITHVAGTKVFGKFNLEELLETNVSAAAASVEIS